MSLSKLSVGNAETNEAIAHEQGIRNKHSSTFKGFGVWLKKTPPKILNDRAIFSLLYLLSCSLSFCFYQPNPTVEWSRTRSDSEYHSEYHNFVSLVAMPRPDMARSTNRQRDARDGGSSRGGSRTVMVSRSGTAGTQQLREKKRDKKKKTSIAGRMWCG